LSAEFRCLHYLINLQSMSIIIKG